MFVPQRPGVVSYKRCAEDDDYVAAFYDEHWWVGLVTQFDTETNDVLIKFMAPHGPRATSSSGRIYSLSSTDLRCINKILN